MLTFFTTAKPFEGHNGMIQRNALKSWKLFDPEVEVILFGDDEGAAEVCVELGLRHERHVERHESGMKYLNYMFGRAQQIARRDVLCYINCDIILMSDFLRAVEQATSSKRPFLMIGRRWDTDISVPLDYARSDWEKPLLRIVSERGKQQSSWYADYFVFSRGLYQNVPPLVIGRIWWDSWLIWKARALKALVVDASPVVVAVHQNHGYSYHPSGVKGTWEDELAKRNYKLAGGRWHIYNISDATHTLNQYGIHFNSGHLTAPTRRALRSAWTYVWWGCLGISRPIRRRLGLRQGTFTNFSNRVRSLVRRR